ncbi:VCBS repeat-containing protein [Maribacter sp. HTCC2170]|uniref:VCBS repeat-containing protein n=1 Tax=Maribacter sp. (strain HTCC2170 / KCCM 42371) TaxID=313603 RepID=UPI00006BB864|nr:VCBS repeat-containing protein [Maribacter sp. HTCC2170]
MIDTIKKTISTLFICFFLISCNNEKKESEPMDTLFTMVSKDYSGLLFQNSVKQSRENNHMINSAFISGGGVAIGDINQDGLQDVFFTGNQVRDRLFLNKGNLEFEDVSDKSNIIKDNSWSTGVTIADIDNDGDQDIYVCKFTYLENEKSANQLYINNGDLTFTEQAATFGLANKGFSIQSTFFDFDNDGLLDVYIVNQPPSIPNVGNKLNYEQFSDILFSDRLYRNLGNGTFEDYTEKANVRNFGFGLSATTGDFNNDGWQDIYVTNDFDVADHLYINQKDGTFKDELKTATKHISNFSMGSDVSDYDNDGFMDVMIVDMMAEDHKRIKTNMGSMAPEQFWEIVDKGGHHQYMFNTLQRNNGNGSFSELGQLAGVTSTDWSWAPLFGDFDNDGLKDLFITNGVVSNNRNSDLTNLYEKKLDSIRQLAQRNGVNPNSMINVMDFANLAPTDKLANYIYKNAGDYTFENKIKEWGMEIPTLSNGAAYADLDLDGDLDLIINNINENVMLYKNESIEKGLGNYIRFKIVSEDNKAIQGAKVTLYENENILQSNFISNARGYMSKSEDVVHFGLGQMKIVERAVVEWPDGTITKLDNLAANKVYEVSTSVPKAEILNTEEKKSLLFSDITKSLYLNNVRHVENEYDDYESEILLPHKMSQFGPSITVGDVNGDDREDFYLGGAAGFPGKLFTQNSNNTFDEINGPWSKDSASEDMGATFVDIDGDKDLDLFVVSGGNEFDLDDPALKDRLYINNGSGSFTKNTNAIPNYLSSGSCVMPHDFDNDGDIDLFIGGRLIPRKYPHPANSVLLENKGGKFIDVTSTLAPELNELGMLTAATWTDYNGDGLVDLVVVGEWMPITIFSQNRKGGFTKSSIENTEGWYYEIKSDDLDGDGDQDLVAGNLGLNYKYKASVEAPFEVHSYDFDNNGSLDIVLSYYEHGEAFPVRGKSCSTQQIPSLSTKFPTYEEFGNSNLDNIYGQSLKTALNRKAKTFASAYLENDGSGKYSISPLHSLAQTSSINSILINDYDQDGYKDLLLVGNLYPAEIETPRNDAGTGLFLKGNGNGEFIPSSINESGFYAPQDAKNMKTIKVGEKEVILIANNNDYIQAIEYIKPN